MIDTGFDFNSTWSDAAKFGLVKPKLCQSGHKDFSREGIQDNFDHGTHITGLIAKYAKNSNYCIVIIKYFSNNSNFNVLQASIESIKHAIDQKIDIINYSSAGRDYNEEEKLLFELALARGIKIIAALGNEGRIMNSMDECVYFPACYNALIERIGNAKPWGYTHPSSNRGNVLTSFKDGINALSLLPNNKYGEKTGTSQATAIRTGELALEMHNKFVRGKK